MENKNDFDGDVKKIITEGPGEGELTETFVNKEGALPLVSLIIDKGTDCVKSFLIVG